MMLQVKSLFRCSEMRKRLRHTPFYFGMSHENRVCPKLYIMMDIAYLSAPEGSQNHLKNSLP
jgi:hypothetical protein